MDYAMKSLSLLTTSSLSRCVTASVSASTSMTQQLLLGRSMRTKPYRVTNADRSVKKGIIAYSLENLMHKASNMLNVECVGALVLDEDGTDVDTQEFFDTLPNNCVLMLLDMEQKWTPHPNFPLRDRVCKNRLMERIDVAKVTFDLYKNNPNDFIGCLNVKATLHGVHSVSYEMRCYAAKKILKEALRLTVFSMQATGHILLGSSCYIRQLLEDDEQVEEKLSLPQKSRMKQLQTMLLGKISYL